MGMKRKAHSAQEPKAYIGTYVEFTSTAQRSDSPAQTFTRRFLIRGIVARPLPPHP